MSHDQTPSSGTLLRNCRNNFAATDGPVSSDSDALYPPDQVMTGNDRWGCELLLCLANPNGWNSVSECRPPVEKYFECSTKRHNPCSMPGCPQSGEGNYAVRNDGKYDPCKLLGEGYQDALAAIYCKASCRAATSPNQAIVTMPKSARNTTTTVSRKFVTATEPARR